MSLSSLLEDYAFCVDCEVLLQMGPPPLGNNYGDDSHPARPAHHHHIPNYQCPPPTLPTFLHGFSGAESQS